MGLKEELAELKKSKLSADMPPAQATKETERKVETPPSILELKPAAKAEQAPGPSTEFISPKAEAAPKQPSKTISVIAEEILREVEERKKRQAMKPLDLAEKTPAAPARIVELALKQEENKPAPQVILGDNVLLPPPTERKTITEIAEQIIAEKQAKGEPTPSKSIEEMMETPPDAPAPPSLEKPEKQDETKTGENNSRQATSQTPEQAKEQTNSGAADNAPRKTLPAIAEEIRKEMGIVEKKKEPELPDAPAPPYATSQLPTEVIDRIAEAKQKAASAEPKRLYLLKPEERGDKKQEREGREVPSLQQHRRRYLEGKQNQDDDVDEPPGFDEMVSEVYVQAKREEEKDKPLQQAEKKEEVELDRKRKEDDARKAFEERRRQRDARKMAGQPVQKEQAIDQTPKSLSIEELLGEKPGEKKAAGGLFGELEKEASGGEGKNLFAELDEASKPSAAKKQADFTVVAKEKGCPNCKIAATKIVYCPYCGGAMCANCATKITPYPDHFTYVCPHCAEEVEVKKKAA